MAGQSFAVTLTGLELEIVTAALGYCPRATPSATPRKKSAPVRKPPTLSAGQFVKVRDRWAEAVADPTKWHYPLMYAAARNTNRPAHTIEAAWGIVDSAEARIVAERAKVSL